MKKLLSVLVAGTLLLALTACQKEQPQPQPVEPPPAVAPELPEQPAQPEIPAAEPVKPAPDAASAGTASVTETVEEDSIEELVSYRIALPQVAAGNAAVDQVINDYYAGVYGKLRDLAWGEAYELALERHTIVRMETDFTVARNEENVLSVWRSVQLTDQQAKTTETTVYAETFNLENGGLLTADDFFSVDEATYLARLADCVARQISEDPYHGQNYFAQWKDLTLSAMEKHQFYVTDEAYVVFYQENDLGDAAETTFAIPWSQLEDIRA